MKKVTINDLNENDIIIDQYGEYSIVRRCVHGNLYYSVPPWYDEECPEDGSVVGLAVDVDENLIPCCDGV